MAGATEVMRRQATNDQFFGMGLYTFPTYHAEPFYKCPCDAGMARPLQHFDFAHCSLSRFTVVILFPAFIDLWMHLL